MRFKTFFRGVAAVQAAGMSTALLISAFREDAEWKAHWRQSKITVLENNNYFRFWRPSFFYPVLRDNERRCLNDWLQAITIEPSSSSALTTESRSCSPSTSPHLPHLSPSLVLHDSLFLVIGARELLQLQKFTSHFVHGLKPTVYAMHREVQGKEAVLLHLKCRSDMLFRIPMTSIVFSCGSFPFTATLVVEHAKSSFFPSLYRKPSAMVTFAEHRWFGGCIWSTQTSSISSPWGDIGDLWRRTNAYVLSLLIYPLNSCTEVCMKNVMK